MSKVSTSHETIYSAMDRLQHNDREFAELISHARGDLDKTRSEANKTLDALNRNKAKAEQNLSTLQSRANKIRSEISQKQRELAACRPPQRVTTTYTDSEGHTHTETHIEDPDGPKRARLQAEIAELQRKLSIIEQSIREFQQYIDKMNKGINTVKGAFPHLDNVEGTINNAVREVSHSHEAMQVALRKSEETLQDYDAVEVRGFSEVGLEPLPYFIYEGGTLGIGGGGGPRMSGGAAPVSGPAKTEVTIIFDKVVQNEDEFKKAILAIINENHCKIILKIHKAIKNFHYETNIAKIRMVLTEQKFVQKKNPIGTYYISVDGYYVFERNV